MPAWITKLERASLPVVLGLGSLLSGLNPKSLAFTLTAAVTIAQAELTMGQQLISVVVYVVLASIGVAVPVLWYFLAQESASRTLAEWRVWLTANYATIMAVVFLLFGVTLTSRGLAGLIGSV
jgi:Sap, sulfolipid-1-addressing protein